MVIVSDNEFTNLLQGCLQASMNKFDNALAKDELLVFTVTQKIVPMFGTF